jgi:hypothetical protein
MTHNDDPGDSREEMAVNEVFDDSPQKNHSAFGKIPLRIKSGHFSQEYFHMVTSSGEIAIPLSSIHYICLGIIEEQAANADGPKSNMRNVIRKLFFGEKPQDDNQKQPTRKLFLVDIYVEGQEAPYRLDSSNINYKTFLGEVSYISQHNFKKLFSLIVDQGTHGRFNRSAAAFYIKKPDRVHVYNSIYDFELDCQHSRAKIKKEISWADIREGRALEILRDHVTGDYSPPQPDMIDDAGGILDDEL